MRSIRSFSIDILEFDILEPIMKCNTMSYGDSVKIEARLASHSGPSRVVDVALGDGQSVILLKNMKVRVTSGGPVKPLGSKEP